ncbi:NAD(P)-binding protein [Xylariaceae sp. FL0804]|nr:NAD(P)-binding protein [Xylariaceae sp. FL0804]
MHAPTKVAVITGGASGMGLGVAHALTARGDWDVHIVDLNRAGGEAAAADLRATTFHGADVTDYEALGAAFRAAFGKHRRLDFVFANAGAMQVGNFYTRHDDAGDELPPPPDMSAVRICLDGVLFASYLALHYFRLSPPEADKSLLMTASCAGLYASYCAPVYTSAKHGVVGLMRALAKPLWDGERVRVNALCPGIVKTGILTPEQWANFPDAIATPMAKIQETVLMLVDGRDETPSAETRIDGVAEEDRDKGGVLWGEAVEPSGNRHYYRNMTAYGDANIAGIMWRTDTTALYGRGEA